MNIKQIKRILTLAKFADPIKPEDKKTDKEIIEIMKRNLRIAEHNNKKDV